MYSHGPVIVGGFLLVCVYRSSRFRSLGRRYLSIVRTARADRHGLANTDRSLYYSIGYYIKLIQTVSASSHSSSQTTMSGKYIVVFKDHVTPDEINKYAEEVQEQGGKIGHRYNSVLKGFSATIPDSYFAQLQQSDVIDYIEPDGVVTTQS